MASRAVGTKVVLHLQHLRALNSFGLWVSAVKQVQDAAAQEAARALQDEMEATKGRAAEAEAGTEVALKELASASEKHKQQLAEHTAALEAAQGQHAEAVASLTLEHETRVQGMEASEAAMAAQHEAAVSRMRGESDAALSAAESAHRDALASSMAAAESSAHSAASEAVSVEAERLRAEHAHSTMLVEQRLKDRLAWISVREAFEAFGAACNGRLAVRFFSALALESAADFM